MPLDPNVTYQLSESGAETDALLDTIGTDALTTTAQTLTGAINELDSDKASASDVGDLSSLVTTDKSNVVSAINEVATDLRGGTLFKLVQYNASYTAAASASATLTASDFDASAPTGYIPIAVVQVGTGNGNVALRYVNVEATGSSNMIGMRNVSTGSISASASIKILYVKVWGS